MIFVLSNVEGAGGIGKKRDESAGGIRRSHVAQVDIMAEKGSLK